ncbi:MAG: MoxR family ATPase [Planctomycetes bacterium]|nr:MoxR family ATPase [Planctomycetota bacterium]
MLRQAAEGYQKLTSQIGRVIIGQQDAVQALLAAIFAEGHVLIVGVPGLAKTLLVKTLAGVLGWRFHRIQFTPDMMPADIIGMELLHDDDRGGRSMRFVPGPVFANIILADEINRTPPKTQSALLEAMQEQTVTSMGRGYPLDRPFVVVATQNPIEQEGTYPLPEAQLDRFMFSLWMDYPSQKEEERIVMSTTAEQTHDLSPVFTKEQMLAFQRLVRRMPVSEHVVSYAVSLARATRPSSSTGPTAKQFVEWGAGPRAGQHMILAAKAMALMEGKPTVAIEHVRRVAPLVLRHRVLANYQAAGKGLGAAEIVSRICAEVGEPQPA